MIVFATGFVGNVREMAGSIVGQEIEDQLEDFWELDAEGEIRGAFKYTGRKYLLSFSFAGVGAASSAFQY